MWSVQFELREVRLGVAAPGVGARLLRLEQEVSLHHERVHPSRQKASVGLLGRADDRFAPNVKAGVDDGRAPGLPGEGLEQSVIPAVTGFVDRLNSSGSSRRE